MRVASFIVGTVVAVISLAALRAAAQQPALGAIVAERHERRIVTVGLVDRLFGGPQQGEPPKSTKDHPPPTRSDGDDDDDDDRPSRREPARSSGGAYRTLCVRLCDGFPVPISLATTKDHLSTDARRCEQQCPARSRLFVYQLGQSLQEMVDLQGKPYRDLPTAFRYQSTYVTNCTCQGNAWDAEALARHQAYAHAPQPNEKAVKSVEQSRAAQPQMPARQSSWGYRDRRARQDDD
jgi:uncharacterized protein DUF2865